MRHPDFYNSKNRSTIQNYGFLIGIAVALWLVTRPYNGIVVDARIYLFGALVDLYPKTLSNDLFVAYGTQTNYSIYSKILAGFIKLFGVAKTNLYMTLIGSIFWIFGLFFLTFSLTNKFHERMAAIISVLVLPCCYILYYGDNYQNPRLFVEPIVLIAVALAFRRVWWGALAVLVVGAVIHPLIAAPGFLLVFIMWSDGNHKSWLFLALACAFGIAFGLLGIRPFNLIFERFDALWFWITLRRIWYFAFVSAWGWSNIFRVLIQINLATIAYFSSNSREQKLLRQICLSVILAMIVQIFGGDFLHDAFIIQVQPYRTTFFLSLFSNFYFGIFLVRIFLQKHSLQWYFAFIFGIWLLQRFITIEAYLVLPCLAFASGAYFLASKYFALNKIAEMSLFAVFCSAGIFSFLLCIIDVFWLPVTPISEQLAIKNCFNFLIIIFTLTFFAFRKINLANTFLIISLGLAFLHYDQRSPWSRLVESGVKPPPDIMKIIDSSSNIYWEDGVEFLWFDLIHTSYYSGVQGAGVMYYRQNAIITYQRGLIFSELNTEDFYGGPNGIIEKFISKQNQHATGPTDISQIADVCKKLPALDLIVLFTKITGEFSAVWHAPAPQYVLRKLPNGTSNWQPISNYYFYQCKNFRTSSEDNNLMERK